MQLDMEDSAYMLQLCPNGPLHQVNHRNINTIKVKESPHAGEKDSSSVKVVRRSCNCSWNELQQYSNVIRIQV